MAAPRTNPVQSSDVAARPPPQSGPAHVWLAAVVLLVATSAAYITSFGGAMVFDDIPGIVENPTIRPPWRLDLLHTAIGPQGGTLSGRPLPNLTLAFNYAIGGLHPTGYHVVNLLIHLAAGLTLFGLVRRTLQRPVLAGAFGDSALPLALLVAALWSLHPLQTEAVTYLVQRVESLMALAYLLTLYAFVRGVESPRPWRWQVAAFIACLAGMACKEVMVSAPLVVLAYDRTFVAGSWHAAWRARWRLHLALMSTWLLLGWLVAESNGRGGTAGFDAGLHSWNYALTQCRSLLGYIRLAFWPRSLVFDHGLKYAAGLADVWLPALGLIGLLAVTGYLLVRRPILGFAGAWFFVILAPTSSFVPVTDAMVEHRMYLPLAGVIALVVLLAYRKFGRACLLMGAGIAVVLGIATALRNRVYASPITLWQDTVRKAPSNPRAHSNLGAYLLEAGRPDEARAELLAALALEPRHASAHYNLGKLSENAGDMPGAITEYQAALATDPKRADAHINLAALYERRGDLDQALPHFAAAVALEPQASDAQLYLGGALLKLRRPAEAIQHLQVGLDLDPDRADGWCSLARAHLLQRDNAAARRAAEKAIDVNPRFAEAHYLLGNLDAAAEKLPAAIAHFRQATEIAPNYVAARNNLANALLLDGQADAAILEYRRILREHPDDRSVQENLARALEVQSANRR